MTAKQRKALEFLWIKYGNGGACHSMANHRFLQRHIEGKCGDAAMIEPQITRECRDAFARVVKDDYSELSGIQKKILEAFEKGFI